RVFVGPGAGVACLAVEPFVLGALGRPCLVAACLVATRIVRRGILRLRRDALLQPLPVALFLVATEGGVTLSRARLGVAGVLLLLRRALLVATPLIVALLVRRHRVGRRRAVAP